MHGAVWRVLGVMLLHTEPVCCELQQPLLGTIPACAERAECYLEHLVCFGLSHILEVNTEQYYY